MLGNKSNARNSERTSCCLSLVCHVQVLEPVLRKTKMDFMDDIPYIVVDGGE